MMIKKSVIIKGKNDDKGSVIIKGKNDDKGSVKRIKDDSQLHKNKDDKDEKRRVPYAATLQLWQRGPQVNILQKNLNMQAWPAVRGTYTRAIETADFNGVHSNAIIREVRSAMRMSRSERGCRELMHCVHCTSTCARMKHVHMPSGVCTCTHTHCVTHAHIFMPVHARQWTCMHCHSISNVNTVAVGSSTIRL